MDSASNPIEQSVVSELAETLERESNDNVDKLDKRARKGGAIDMNLYLVAFRDGSYKKIRAVDWKHSQWIHFTLPDGSVVRVNPETASGPAVSLWRSRIFRRS